MDAGGHQALWESTTEHDLLPAALTGRLQDAIKVPVEEEQVVAVQLLMPSTWQLLECTVKGTTHLHPSRIETISEHKSNSHVK